MKLQRDTCPICLDPFPATTSTVQPCKHSFCRPCIYTWAALRTTCPLCLEPFATISILNEEEDTKEEIVRVNDPSRSYLITPDEEFECLDHKHFVKEFQALYKRAKEAEYELKANVMMKKGGGSSDRNYQLIMHVKQEIELKLAFLSQERKIIPKELLQEVEHFSGLINSFRYGITEKTSNIEMSSMPDVYAEDDYYEGQQQNFYDEDYSLFDFAVKKSGKKSKKTNKKGKAKGKLDAWEEDF